MLDFLKNLRRRIVGRMLLYVVLPTLLVFATVISLATRAGFTNLREASEQRMRLEAARVALQITDANNSAVLSAQRMAEAQMAGMFGDRGTSLNYARMVLENDPYFTGAYFGYEPNADGKDAESLGVLPAEAMNGDGRFIPYWYVTPVKGRTIALEPMVDMETSLYFQGAKEAFSQSRKPTALITEPYVYQGKMIVENVFPIIIDGEFAGVAGIDVALADLETALRQIAEKGDIDIFVISSRGNFIAATSDQDTGPTNAASGTLKTQAVEATAYGELFSELVRTKQQASLRRARDPLDGGQYYFAVADVPTGNWSVIVRDSESQILAPIWAQLRTRLTTALSGIAVVISLLVFMTIRLSRRVRLAAETAERVANGDLAVEVKCDNCQDETGVLIRAIQKMTSNLNHLVSNVKQASIQLNSTATELSATSRQQESTVGSFGASASQIAAAAKQISATSAELVKTMDEVTKNATGTAELATAGRTSLQSMEANMRGLDTATTLVGEKLSVINEKAANITGIVTTITKVADQTNLLSVNAAIEAEKAGEYGVGFLVVAREIRRLADQTAAATFDIDQMVQQMQSAVSTGVMEMDRFTEQVGRSVHDVADISRHMTEIIERVNANTQKFALVNESMQSQSQGADQISQSMGQLTAHASQTTQAISEYADAAKVLQESIGALRSSISSFQLKNSER